MKIFHFSDKLRNLESQTVSAPLHVRLKPTNRCNHRCNYCCYRNQALYLNQRFQANDEIPWVKMCEILDDFIEMGVLAVTFSGGGEPLMYPQVGQAIERLVDRNIKVGMLTNGALLHGTVAQLLARRATWIRISLDSAQAKGYALNRNTSENELEKVCRNIAMFAGIANRTCELGVNFIVTDRNFGEVYDFLGMMKELGADHVKISEAVVSVEFAENVAYVKNFFAPVKEQIERAKRQLADDAFAIIDKVLNIETISKWPNNYQKQYAQCPFIQCLTVVAADQSVYACQDKAYTDSGFIGSLRERSFRQLWRAETTRQKLIQLNPAAECKHHCVQHEKNLILLDYLEADRTHLEFV